MKKGFTLIELLAVIALLGILVSLSVPSIIKYLDQASDAGMQNQENSVTAAAKVYIEDHCSNPLYGYKCPDSYTKPGSGKEKYVCLSMLQNDTSVESGIKRQSYIGPIKNDESMCYGVVIFAKNDSKTNSSYNDVKTYLVCGENYSGGYDYETDDTLNIAVNYSDCLK